jgi:hypothetical protein
VLLRWPRQQILTNSCRDQADDLLRYKIIEECFRFLDRRNSPIQFFLGLMPELIIPSVGPVVLLPEFVSTLPDLFFVGFSISLLSNCGHLGMGGAERLCA